MFPWNCDNVRLSLFQVTSREMYSIGHFNILSFLKNFDMAHKISHIEYSSW